MVLSAYDNQQYIIMTQKDDRERYQAPIRQNKLFEDYCVKIDLSSFNDHLSIEDFFPRVMK